MSFPSAGLAAVLTLGTLAPSALAQSAVPPSATLVVTGARAPTPASPTLKAEYRVGLVSTWPQETARGGCRNGGVETLEGMLSRRGDRYTGTFTRRTEILFCGGHGGRTGADAAGCALRLKGRGRVDVTGVVTGDETSPSGRAVRLTWIPAPGQEAEVSGACAQAFQDAVKAMYFSTPHGAEVPLTPIGAGPRTERLENYAWQVTLE